MQSKIFKIRYLTAAQSYSFAALIVSLFFDVKLPINSDFAYFLGEKKDFTIIFIRFSDIALAVFALSSLLVGYVQGIKEQKRAPLLASVFILTFSILSIIFNYGHITIPVISVYYLLSIAKLHVLHGTLHYTGAELKKTFTIWFCGAALLQVPLEIYQFAHQKSFGLAWLGESTIGPYFSGVAKVEALGQVFLRPYGSMPHPNILGAFLSVALAAALSFSRNTNNKKTRIYEYLLAIPLIIGLFMTFSRAGWLAGAIILSAYGGFDIIRAIKTRTISELYKYLAYLCTIIILITIFYPFVRQRGNVFDKAYSERKSYNYAGLSILSQNPALGLGPSESVIHMEQLLGPSTAPSSIQPIHNYYLISAAEIGLPATIGTLIYLIIILGNNLKSIIYKRLIYNAPPFGIAIMTAIIVLMLFDHYFYTYSPAGILAWISIYIASHET